MRQILQTFILCVLVFLSGFATLCWEVIWQLKSSFAIGISAQGTALTFMVMMAGMSLGSLLMGRWIRHVKQALYIYSCLELLIGLAGFALTFEFALLEKLDSWIYLQFPYGVLSVQMMGIICVLLLPAFCMGATFPIFGLLAKEYEWSIARLYSVNTMGAAFGVLAVALIFIPWLGVQQTMVLIAAVNVLLAVVIASLSGLATSLFRQRLPLFRVPPSFRSLSAESNVVSGCSLEATTLDSADKLRNDGGMQNNGVNILLIFTTGFVTFVLEIAWFRSLEATFLDTTDVFAIMLASLLIILGMAANRARKLQLKNRSLHTQILLAGILTLLITPIIERFDRIILFPTYYGLHKKMVSDNNLHWLIDSSTFIANNDAFKIYLAQLFVTFVSVYLVLVLPMRYLGVVFPWIVGNQASSREQGKLYAVNTLAAVLGAFIAAWVFLPTLGFVKTTWLAGVLIVLAGLVITPHRQRMGWCMVCACALYIAIDYQDGIGNVRVQGFFANFEGQPARVLASHEGPQATVSVVEYQDQSRALLINSATAAGEVGKVNQLGSHYMPWMGHLPMLLHPLPANVLVMCFGIGQTVNAVRKENPQQVDVVDVNPQVFKLAHYFKSNEHVLADERVHAITMDGRAYLRRTNKRYDIITLEPMPPFLQNMNSLYSREFYEAASGKLTSDGIMVQWLPLHMVAPQQAASIVKTFIAVFPNALLWIDPAVHDGVLMGTKNKNNILFGKTWPGFSRQQIPRNLPPEQVKKYVVLDAKQLQAYGRYGKVITDDNQLLAYGKALYLNIGMQRDNFSLIYRFNPNVASLVDPSKPI